MGSLVLKTQDDEIIPFEFSTVLTVASLIASLLFVYIGLLVSSKDRAYSKSREDIAEMTLSDASSMTIKEIKETNFLILALFKDLSHLITGGIITASGIVTMHYIGMMAVVFPGTITWNIGLVFSSVIIAIVASIGAFWILFRLLALYPDNEMFRLAGSIVMAVAISGMHYSGAAAAEFNYEPDLILRRAYIYNTVTSHVAVLVALGVGTLYLFFVLFLMLADLRAWVVDLSKNLIQIDILVKGSQKIATRNHDQTIDIEIFTNKYDLIFVDDVKKCERLPAAFVTSTKNRKSILASTFTRVREQVYVESKDTSAYPSPSA
jgi:NO-binding membrane sensor protein with MHYT domain